ncbi:MAG: hypothetical protein ACRCWR_12515, partial [Saezia sp.]
ATNNAAAQANREKTLNNLIEKGVPVLSLGNVSIPLHSAGEPNTWSLFNLLIAIAGSVFTIISALFAVRSRKDDNLSYKTKIRAFVFIALLLGIANLLLFLITASLQGLCVLFDNWSVLMAILFILQIVLLARVKRKHARGDSR